MSQMTIEPQSLYRHINVNEFSNLQMLHFNSENLADKVKVDPHKIQKGQHLRNQYYEPFHNNYLSLSINLHITLTLYC